MQVKPKTAKQVISEYLEDAFALHPGHMTASGLVGRLREAGYAIVSVPDIAFKGPHDTNGSMLITAAEKAESARYPVGGSNVGCAVAQVLREVAAAAD